MRVTWQNHLEAEYTSFVRARSKASVLDQGVETLQHREHHRDVRFRWTVQSLSNLFSFPNTSQAFVCVSSGFLLKIIRRHAVSPNFLSLCQNPPEGKYRERDTPGTCLRMLNRQGSKCNHSFCFQNPCQRFETNPRTQCYFAYFVFQMKCILVQW